MKEISEQQALSRLASECSRAEHCTGEMMQKLRLWGIAPEASKRIVDYLVDNKYVDDCRFARMFVRDKLKFNKWGRRKIAEALWAKKVSPDVQEEALSELSDEDYAEVLLPLLRSKSKTIKASSDYEWSAKIIKYALSRGFGMEIIRRCVDAMGKQLEGDYE